LTVLTVVEPGYGRSLASPPNRTIEASDVKRDASAWTTSVYPTSLRALDGGDHEVLDLADLGQARGERLGFAEVQSDPARADPDLAGHGLGPGRVSPGDNDLSAPVGEQPRHFFAKAGGPADDHDAP
jgi:hypothetical protein